MTAASEHAYAAGKAAGRAEARAEFEKAWTENLPLVTERARREERASVERRVRESGVARWLPSHQWETLITAIRGPQ